MDLNDRAMPIIAERDEIAKRAAEELEAKRLAKRESFRSALRYPAYRIKDIFTPKIVKYERFIGKEKSEFFINFLKWMKNSRVPYDHRKFGWRLGTTTRTHVHEGVAYHSNTTSPTYWTHFVDMYVNRQGVVVLACPTVGLFDYILPDEELMEDRIVQAIADSGGKLSWP